MGRLMPGLGDGMGSSGGRSADGSDGITCCEVMGSDAEELSGPTGMRLSVGMLYYSSRPILDIW